MTRFHNPLPIPQSLNVAFEGGGEFGPAGSGVADGLDSAALPDSDPGIIERHVPPLEHRVEAIEGLSGQRELLLGQRFLGVWNL